VWDDPSLTDEERLDAVRTFASDLKYGPAAEVA
jgi:hypothetical protein